MSRLRRHSYGKSPIRTTINISSSHHLIISSSHHQHWVTNAFNRSLQIKFEAIVDEKFKEMILTNYTVGLLNYSDTDTIGGKTGNEMYEEAVSESDDNYLKEVRKCSK